MPTCRYKSGQSPVTDNSGLVSLKGSQRLLEVGPSKITEGRPFELDSGNEDLSGDHQNEMALSSQCRLKCVQIRLTEPPRNLPCQCLSPADQKHGKYGVTTPTTSWFKTVFCNCA